ncbi:MAG TPA: hypothetical protein VHD36_01825 [Pirellulales bacterium]|nr:hypothetical protein [Pirellulales bacterium]
MDDAALKVLAIFRRYRVGPGQMLFIHNLDSGLNAAMTRLMDDGLVTSAGPKNAFCLTASGYAAVRAV